MRVNHRVVGPLVGGLVLAGTVGAVAAVWMNRGPEPLPALAVETLAPPTGISLPARVDGSAFAFDSPVDGQLGGDLLTVPLAAPPAASSVGLVSVPRSGGFDSLEHYTDWQRRHAEDSHVVDDPVVEHSALGAAVRKDLVMNDGLTITQWAVEHGDHLYLVEWMHSPDDDTWRPTVEAMIASWRWS